MAESRVAKSMKNSIVGLIGMFITLILSFVSKSVFIQYLGNDYNGLNYLFTGILNALNLAELGFASTIAFSLYKPLSQGDELTVSAIMNFFKNVYRLVAVVVAIIGAACIPLLPYLIKDFEEQVFSLSQLQIYFAIYLANTVLSYLLAYKRTLISADQRAYIISLVDYSANIVLVILQIVLLIITKNYYVFLAIMVAKTVISNVILAVVANKKYPYLAQHKDAKLLTAEKQKIFRNVRAMMLHKVGSVVILNTTTIVMSAVVGLQENGIYGNYMTIISQVAMVINIVFGAMVASVGNLCVDSDEETQYIVFKRINYLATWAMYFTFVCYVCLFNPFIDIWLGEGMTFGIWTVVLLSVNASIEFVRSSVLTFRDAKGLFRVDRYKPLVEAAIGISGAIGFGYLLGVDGVVLGYLIAKILIAIPVELWVLFRRGFHKSIREFLLTDISRIALTAIVTLGMYYLTSLLTGIGGFVINFILCLIIPNAIFVAVTFWTDEFKYFYSLTKRIIKGIFQRIRRGKKSDEVAAVNNEENNAEVLPDKEMTDIVADEETGTDDDKRKRTNNRERDTREDNE